MYVLVRRRLGRLAATLFAIPLLLFGSGAENLFWAFQTGFVGSVAFGVWALVAIERIARWPAVAASALLMAALMSSGIGLVFLAAAFVRTLVDPQVRRNVLVAVPPAVAYVVWYAWAGHAPLGQPDHFASAPEIARFVGRGISYSTAAVTGVNRLPMGDVLAGAAFAAALVALGWAAFVRRQRRPLAIASLLAIVAVYVLAGAVRAHLEFEYATVSRYVYVVGFLLALALADVLEPLRVRLEPRRAGAEIWVAFVLLGSAFVTLANLGPLRHARDDFLHQADRTRAFVALAEVHGGEPWVDAQSGYGVMPSVPELVATVERHGSPARDRFFPSIARAPSGAAYEEALLVMLGGNFRFELASEAPFGPLDVALGAIVDATVARRGDCFLVTAVGPRPSATFSGDDGSRYRVSAESGERVTVVLGLERPPAVPLVADLSAREPVDVVVPDIGPVESVRLRIELPRSSSPVTVCPLNVPRP